MDKHTLWSLRLGFSAKHSIEIAKQGIGSFVKNSFKSSFDDKLPEFLKDDPKTLEELKEIRQEIKMSDDAAKKKLKKNLQNGNEMRLWWLGKMIHSPSPLREKMVVFWHNHFVATSQKVKVNYWIYQHNQILRENAFGNFRELTKKMLFTNAIVRYLDNVDNRKGKINENLSRELLELFTIGIGNYTEEDVKQGAKGLAGLNIGDNGAQYRRMIQDDDTINYFGKKGVFKANDMVDIIFSHKNTPYHLMRKLLKWFIYDQPDEKLVTYYGDYFRSVDYEMEPMLLKIFTEEFDKKNAGSKIKDPLTYSLQLLHETGLDAKVPKRLPFFLAQQGMDLFNQPNVKGWDGGQSWLSAQTYTQRNQIADFLCLGKGIGKMNRKRMEAMNMEEAEIMNFSPVIKLNSAATSNKEIIRELSDRLFFSVDDELQKKMEQVLKYDFNPKEGETGFGVLRLFNMMIKQPEFQII